MERKICRVGGGGRGGVVGGAESEHETVDLLLNCWPADGAEIIRPGMRRSALFLLPICPIWIFRRGHGADAIPVRMQFRCGCNSGADALIH